MSVTARMAAKKAAKIVLGSAAAAVVLVCGTAAFVLGTDSGLKALCWGLQKALPGFEVKELTGSLFDFKAKGLAYEAPGLSFAGDVELKVRLREILSGRLAIENVALSDAALYVRTAEMASAQPAQTNDLPAASENSASALPSTQSVADDSSAKSTADSASGQSSAGAPARLQAPLDVVLERLNLSSVSADIDGNALSLGELDAGASWVKDLVALDRFEVSDVNLALAPSAPSAESVGEVLKRTFASPVLPEIGAIDVPVDVELKRFLLQRFTLKGEPDQSIESASFALSVRDGTLKVEDFAARMMNLAAVAGLSLGLDARHEVELAAVVSAELARESIPTGYGVNPIEIEPTVEERAKFYERLQEARQKSEEAARERRAARRAAREKAAKSANVAGKTAGAAAAQENKPRAQRTAQQRSEAALRFKQKVEAWRAKARGELVKTVPRMPVVVALNLKVHGALSDTVTVTGVTDNIPGVEKASFEAKLSPAAAGLPVNVNLRAPWVTLSGGTLSDYRFELKGKAVDYAFDAKAKVHYPTTDSRVLTSDFTLTGKGTELAADISRMAFVSNAGRLEIAGNADWSEEPRFAVTVHLADINTREILPQAPLAANGSFAAWGAQKNGAWYAKLQDLTILGKLRGEPLAITGALETRGNGVVHTPGLSFSVGRDSLKLSGLVDVAKEVPELNLKAAVDAPDLRLLDPNLKGSVRGNIAVSGNAQLPVIDADVRATGIAYGENVLQSARLTGRVRSQASVSGEVKLELTQLRTSGVELPKTTVTLKGSEWKHTLTVHAQGTPASVDLTMTGAYQRLLNNWTGELASLKVTTDFGPVTLDKPMALGYFSGIKRFRVGKACLSHPEAQVCLDKDLMVDLTNKSDLRVLASLQKFDLAFLKNRIQSAFEARGVIAAQLDMTVPAGMTSLPHGTLKLQAKGIETVYRMALDDLKVGFETIDLTVSNTADSVDARWFVDIAKNGDIAGRLRVADIFGARTLDGALTMNALDATLVNSFLSPGETAQGELYGDLRFAGTADEPLIYGKTGVTGAKLDSTKLPFEMLASDMTLSFEGNRSSLDGLLRTPKGEIKLAGSADWRTLGEGRAVVSAKGVDFRVTLPPDIQFDLSTDVRCEASADLIRLDGSIALPWARVVVNDLPPSTVDVSDDVVRTDRPRPKKRDASKAIPIESNLFIHIGDDVRVEAMGLKARLTGDLHVIQDNGSLGLTGQISVPNGRFKAYGQDLIVRRGQFQFTGAAANPMLDLEAIRNPERTADDVIAGVRVKGTASFPQVEVFADPSKSETEALSYLIRGEGLDPSGESDNTMITSALINLGLSQGSQVFESLGDAVGISGLGLETEGVGDSSQLVVSGYVLPGLKVKYGVGIFDSLATLTLRYRIIPKLYVEAVSGVDQALDLLYSFEF